MNRRLRYAGPALVLLVAGMAAWASQASRAGARVEGCPQGCSTAGPSGQDSLRVMSLNVLHEFPTFRHLRQRLDTIAGEIRAQ